VDRARSYAYPPALRDALPIWLFGAAATAWYPGSPPRKRRPTVAGQRRTSTGLPQTGPDSVVRRPYHSRSTVASNQRVHGPPDSQPVHARQQVVGRHPPAASKSFCPGQPEEGTLEDVRSPEHRPRRNFGNSGQSEAGDKGPGGLVGHDPAGIAFGAGEGTNGEARRRDRRQQGCDLCQNVAPIQGQRSRQGEERAHGSRARVGPAEPAQDQACPEERGDRKSTRLNSSH